MVSFSDFQSAMERDLNRRRPDAPIRNAPRLHALCIITELMHEEEEEDFRHKSHESPSPGRPGVLVDSVVRHHHHHHNRRTEVSKRRRCIKADEREASPRAEALGPPPAPPVAVREPPEPIRSAIAAMGGTEVGLVIEKGLNDSDTRREQNRLSIPMRQVVNPGFLTAEETATLSSRDEKHKPVGIDAVVVEPDGCHRKTITLKRWDMYKEADKKGHRTCSSSYVLNNTWFDIVNRHRLKANTVVQLWSFRLNSNLCFALAVIR